MIICRPTYNEVLLCVRLRSKSLWPIVVTCGIHVYTDRFTKSACRCGGWGVYKKNNSSLRKRNTAYNTSGRLIRRRASRSKTIIQIIKINRFRSELQYNHFIRIIIITVHRVSCNNEFIGIHIVDRTHTARNTRRQLYIILYTIL